MKKNWNVAKIFTLLITVLFLASTLFVGCKEQEPEPEPEPSPVMYTVTYAVEGGEKISVTGIPEPKTVEKGTVLKVDDLPTLTEPEGWTFEGWYIGEEPFTSDYTVTSNIIITAKFVENVAPSLPAGGEEGSTTPPAGGEEGSTTPPAGGEEGSTTPPAGGDEGSTTPPAGGEEGSTTPPAGGDEGSSTPEPEPTPDTTNNFEGNYYAGDMGYIEFTTETDCVVFVVSEVYATYTVADNVATIKGVKISDEEDYSAIEIKTTTLANDSFSVTYPVEICQIFDPFASENMVITYTKVDNPSSEGGEGVVVPDPDPVETFLVTYTVEGIDANLVTGLPETGSVNKDTVLNLSSLEAPEGYVFDGWFINDEGVSQHTVVAAVTIVAKFSVIAEEEPSKTTYTITNVKASWVGDNDVVVYAYLPAAATEDDVQKDYLFGASYEDGVVSFSTDEEFSTAVVITVPNGTSIDGLSPTSDENGPDIWDYKLLQTDDLDFTGTTTVALPDVSTVTFYVKIPTWDPAITPVKIAIADNGYNWDEFEMKDCGNSWFKYEATNIHDLNSSTTYQLRLVQGESVKYQRAGNNQDNPAIAAPDGFVVIDLTSSMEWGDGCAGGFYTTAVTTPETVPELN